MQSIHQISQRIRDHVNSNFREALLSAEINDEQVFCSLDTIEDTELAIEAFRNDPFPEEVGQRYLWLYGVLQSLVVQQDALKDLGAYFNQKINPTDHGGAKSIRALRNSVAGHPTKQAKQVENGPVHNAIERVSISQNGFKRLRASTVGREFDEVSLPKYFEIQEEYVKEGLAKVLRVLEEQVTNHARKWLAQPLTDILQWTEALESSLRRGNTLEVRRVVERVRIATKERLLDTHLSDYHDPLIYASLARLPEQPSSTQIDPVKRCLEKFSSELSGFDEEFQKLGRT